MMHFSRHIPVLYSTRSACVHDANPGHAPAPPVPHRSRPRNGRRDSGANDPFCTRTNGSFAPRSLFAHLFVVFGRAHVTPRFVRHFNVIGYVDMSDDDKRVIFCTILDNFLSIGFESSMARWGQAEEQRGGVGTLGSLFFEGEAGCKRSRFACADIILQPAFQASNGESRYREFFSCQDNEATFTRQADHGNSANVTSGTICA